MLDGAKFVHEDRLLDAAAIGPRWLLRADIASKVCDVLLQGELDGQYELGTWVIMPNHVHLILLPKWNKLSQAIGAIKARTAKHANQLLVRSGQPFWARDYYDHWIRNRNEEQKIARYIEQNPVNAGLCESAERWPWSSLGMKPGNAAGAACT